MPAEIDRRLGLQEQGAMAPFTVLDGGELDGDPVYDRAVGPMQFLPSTFAAYGDGGDIYAPRDAILEAAWASHAPFARYAFWLGIAAA